MTNPTDRVFPSNGNVTYPGLTKREYFAAMALQGLCLRVSPDYTTGECNSKLVQRSCLLADLLMLELNKAASPDESKEAVK